MADLAVLQQTLGVSFKDISRLEQALVHGSYINENPEPALRLRSFGLAQDKSGQAQASNGRLEFLGDAVLGLIVAEKLYQDYPHFNEGEMTRFRAALVRQETLARIAGAINLGNYLYLGRGEEAGGGRDKPANLAAALEAVIAAVFLDRGLAKVRDCILRLMDAEIEKAVSQRQGIDYKSELQHLIQSKLQDTPTYHVIETSGPEHGKTFTVEVRLGETTMGTGSGKSKKAAETEAARLALERIARVEG